MGGTPLRFRQLEIGGNRTEREADGGHQARARVGAPESLTQQRQLPGCGADGTHALLHPGVTEGLELVSGQQWVQDRLIKPWR